MDRLFQRQLEKSRLPSGEIDIDALGALVTAAYGETADDRRRTDRSITLMIEELDQLNSGLEQEVHKRTAQLRDKRAELQVQNDRFEAALTHMTHGLAMFDAESRLVISNRRWRQMYNLPLEFARSGSGFLDIVTRLSESGLLSQDFQSARDYVSEVQETVKSGEATHRLLELADGRSYSVSW